MSGATFSNSMCGTPGCIDATACNYDEEATAGRRFVSTSPRVSATVTATSSTSAACCGGDGIAEGACDSMTATPCDVRRVSVATASLKVLATATATSSTSARGVRCDGIAEGACDCDGNVLDECGVCGGDGIAEGACDCDGNVLDECGVCGGDGIAEGACDCDGNVLDECGVCGGDGIAEGACDCDGNVLDECGVCGGDGIAEGACDLRRQRPRRVRRAVQVDADMDDLRRHRRLVLATVATASGAAYAAGQA